MEKLCYEVNDEGYIIEHYFLDEDEIEIKIFEGKKMITVPWKDGFHTPKYDFETQSWIEGNQGKLLEDYKDAKKEELNKMCDDKIVDGFIAFNGHHYRTNRDDQINMIGQKHELMDDPTIEVVSWKTEDMGYIDHTREEWLQIYSEAFAHKKEQLFKYDDLKKQVLLCQTVEEVEAIQWI